MTPCLAALVKRVVVLHDIGLRACHWVKEFTIWRIRPLCRRDKLAYECLRLADPSRELADSKVFNSIYCCWWCDILVLIGSLYHIVLTGDEVLQLVSRLFDKYPSTGRPTSMLVPFFSENPHPLVRASIFIDLLYFHCWWISSGCRPRGCTPKFT
jgi:hypothetical protein